MLEQTINLQTNQCPSFISKHVQHFDCIIMIFASI